MMHMIQCDRCGATVRTRFRKLAIPYQSNLAGERSFPAGAIVCKGCLTHFNFPGKSAGVDVVWNGKYYVRATDRQQLFE